MNEEWRPCFDGHYAVSNLGRVRREVAAQGTRCGVLKAGLVGSGYEVVSPCVDGKVTRVYVHHLVATAFIGPCPRGKEINHKDAVKRNNRSDNLEYVNALRADAARAINGIASRSRDSRRRWFERSARRRASRDAGSHSRNSTE